MSLLPASIKRIGQKQQRKGSGIIFPIISRWGLSVAIETNFDPICLKTLCSPMILHIKFDQDWPTGFRDIQIQKGEIFVTEGQVTPN